MRLRRLSTSRFDEGLTNEYISSDPWGESPVPFLKGQRWNYVACEECGQAFHSNILTPEWNERRFSKWMTQAAIEAFEKTFKTPGSDFRTAAAYTAHVLRLEKLTRQLRAGASPRVLDFGCGYGGFLSMCSMYGFDAVGVDRSSAKRENGIHARVFAEIEEVEGLSPFHALTLFEVVEHLDDPRSLVERLAKLLVRGGILILEAPDCSGVTDIKARSDYNKIHPLEHINGFTPKTLKLFAERLGFEHIRRTTTFVACDWITAGRSGAKQLVNSLLAPTTQMYFRKL